MLIMNLRSHRFEQSLAGNSASTTTALRSLGWHIAAQGDVAASVHREAVFDRAVIFHPDSGALL